MELSSIITQYLDAFNAKYESCILPSIQGAINAILRCRTPDSGELYVHCDNCGHTEWRPLSCGNRNCPKCQNHEASEWLDRQEAKLLPVEYFMATFTLPFELRQLAWCNQKAVYTILFDCASSTLKDFGLNPKHLGADIGMTAVLHTHTRAKDYHPHVHFIVPGGGIHKGKRQWIKLDGKYLFNEFALANVFRARVLDALNQAKLPIPMGVPKEWVVDCAHVGKGKPALKYLSRYLYRGVLTENDIISNQNGSVTFRYTNGNTGETRYRTLKGEDFLWLVLQHVLPRGFRRVRDYGFLHGNAKKLLKLVQLVFHVIIKNTTLRPRPVFKCPKCKSPMSIRGFLAPAWKSG